MVVFLLLFASLAVAGIAAHLVRTFEERRRWREANLFHRGGAEGGSGDAGVVTGVGGMFHGDSGGGGDGGGDGCGDSGGDGGGGGGD